MKGKEKVPCPYCGEMIPAQAKACPYCGSDDQTGWSEQTYLDGIDLGDDIDYDELVENEFTEGNYSKKWWTSWKVITGMVLLALFVIALFRLLS